MHFSGVWFVMWKENRQIKLNHTHTQVFCSYGIITVSKSTKIYTIWMVIICSSNRKKNIVSVTEHALLETKVFLGSIWFSEAAFPKTKTKKYEEPLLKTYQRFWLNNVHSQEQDKTRQNRTHKRMQTKENRRLNMKEREREFVKGMNV